MDPRSELRWPLVDDDADPQGTFFGRDIERHVGKGEFRGMEFLHVRARRIINEVPNSSRMPFRFTINPYRGCSHACTYCFARPTHEYLGLSSGDDFDRRIVVKVNAVERVRAEVAPARWGGHHIAMGTNTDPYQRCEGKYRLTRGVVEVLGAAASPFSILTKSTLILRDLDVLAEAASRTSVRANFSIGTLDEHVWRATEPGTPHPMRRVEAVARLNEAGIPCGVLVAPVLSGLSDGDDQLAAVVGACVEAGARSITPLLLHLRPGVREHWMEWLAAARPDRVAAYEHLYPRSYAPRRTQEELGRRVAELVARFGGITADARQARALRPTAPAVAPTSPEDRQLSLDVP